MKNLKNILIYFIYLLIMSPCSTVVSGTKEDLECFKDDDSIWDSNPIELNDINIQILDKISGKVFRKNIKKNEPILFGNIKLNSKRCLKNSPEDYREIYGFIEVYENNEKIFSKWLFASSPSINLFSHAVYDIRIEF